MVPFILHVNRPVLRNPKLRFRPWTQNWRAWPLNPIPATSKRREQLKVMDQIVGCLFFSSFSIIEIIQQVLYTNRGQNQSPPHTQHPHTKSRTQIATESVSFHISTLIDHHISNFQQSLWVSTYQQSANSPEKQLGSPWEGWALTLQNYQSPTGPWPWPIFFLLFLQKEKKVKIQIDYELSSLF